VTVVVAARRPSRLQTTTVSLPALAAAAARGARALRRLPRAEHANGGRARGPGGEGAARGAHGRGATDRAARAATKRPNACRMLGARRSAAKRPQRSNAGGDPHKSWPPGPARRVAEVARGSAQSSPVARSRGSNPMPRSGGLHSAHAAASRDQTIAHEEEGQECCGPRVFFASKLPNFLARWRVRGPAGTGSVGDSVGEGAPRRGQTRTRGCQDPCHCAPREQGWRPPLLPKERQNRRAERQSMGSGSTGWDQMCRNGQSTFRRKTRSAEAEHPSVAAGSVA